MCKTYNGCEEKLENVVDINKKHFSRDVKLTGSEYLVEDTHQHHYYKHHTKRRRLFTLTGSASGSCANRL